MFFLFCCYAHILVRPFYSLFRFCLQLFCLLVREHSLQMGYGNLKVKGWVYNSVVKSSGFSLRRHRLNSKHYSSSQYFITPVPSDSCLCIDTLVGKIPIHVKMKKLITKLKIKQGTLFKYCGTHL